MRNVRHIQSVTNRRWSLLGQARPGAHSLAGVLTAAALGCTGVISEGGPSSPATEAPDPGGRAGVTTSRSPAAGGRSGHDAPGGAAQAPPGSRETTPACVAPEAGPSRLLRLTRFEYDNAVRDVLGVDAAASTRFATDEKLGPFFANGDAAVSEAVYRHYVEAAERVAEAASQRLDRIAPCPAGTAEADCARSLITSVGKRLFRRPLSTAELDAYARVYTSARMDADHRAGARAVLATMLQSPHFLYRIERGAGPAGGDGVSRLTPFEVAARLASFLWGSAPDGPLLAAAEAGQLATPSQVEAQARRMLTTPAAGGAVAHFFSQWLRLEQLDLAVLDEDLRRAMRTEALGLVEALFSSGRLTPRELLLSRKAVLDEGLRRHYGLAAGLNDLPATQRAGLLTRAAFLASNRNVPARGKFVWNELLCNSIEVPPELDTTLAPRAKSENPRQHIDRHRDSPACNACHRLLDPMGHTFWHYDELGRYTDEIDGWTVDARGALVGTAAHDGMVNGATELSARLAEAPEVARCLVRQWFRYALAREPDERLDACSLKAAEERFAAADHDVRELLIALAGSDAFLHRRAPRGQTPAAGMGGSP